MSASDMLNELESIAWRLNEMASDGFFDDDCQNDLEQAAHLVNRVFAIENSK